MKNLNFSLVVFIAFCLKLLVFGTSYSEAIALFAVAGLYAYSLHLDAHKPQPVTAQLEKDVEYLKTSVDAMKSKLIFKPSLNQKL